MGDADTKGRFERRVPKMDELLKRISYAVLVWFLRVVMSIASQQVMFNVPETALGYALISGLVELLILGALYGLTLEPTMIGASGG